MTELHDRRYLNLQPAPDRVDPSRVRIDIVYTGNQDGDSSTPSVALVEEMKATFWYMPNHCIA